MAIKLNITAGDLPPLVGIAGAGSRGSLFARRYIDNVLLRIDCFAGFSLMSLNRPDRWRPAVCVVIAYAIDVNVRAELAAWTKRFQSSSPGLVLFLIVGDMCGVSLPGHYVQIQANGDTKEQLTAALNCVAQMLLGYNLVNLRACELRETWSEARQLFFATGIGLGEQRALAALDKALETPGIRQRVESAHGIWAHVAAPNIPDLWEVARVNEALHGLKPCASALWTGGTDLQAETDMSRVSMLVSME